MGAISNDMGFLHTVEVFGNELPPSAIKLHHVRELRKWKDNGGVVVDEAYFSGEYPSVYYKKVSDFQEPHVKAILAAHKKIWNQGKVTFLVVESDAEFRVVNCSEKPFVPFQQGKSLDDLTLLKGRRDDAGKMQELKAVFGKISIESGLFWKEKNYAQKVKSDKRVEKVLVENMKTTRRELRKELPPPIIHNLLLRSLFVLYLEDRGANNPEFYAEYLPGAKSYFDILKSHEATYRLFQKLDTSFNGNLSPVTDDEKNAVNDGHLLKIKECFWSKIQQHGQLTLFDWRMFDFSVIPIQLISEIYEDFLRDEKGEAEQSAKGAFYTPHPLAEFIMNEVLPYPSEGDNRYNYKILDPTCGSGIFLVESLNRLLDRWEAAHEGTDEKLTFEKIEEIVCDNIFGIEVQSEAIKVAAFSLYLAMLDRLDPKVLWAIKKFPYLIHDPDEEDAEKRGSNLFRMDSIESGPFEKIKYDFVVGNPPFGTKELEDNVKEYVQNLGFATETVLAFLHRATVLCPEGKIALIATSKILFNNKSTYQNFRQFFFNELDVEKIYNFSILRKVSMEEGRKYIPNASVPISIFFYSKNKPVKSRKKLFYCAPKTAIKNQLIDGIAIDPTDIKYLPMEECRKPNSKIWKVAMYGTERDFDMMKAFELTPSIEEFADKRNWDRGAGFRLPSEKFKKKTDLEIRLVPYLDVDKVDRYHTPEKFSEPFNEILFRWLGDKGAYKGPHVLLKEGQKDNKFCASFLDYSCSFKGTIYGIHSTNENELKLLTAYLNSYLSSYLMFLTSVDWGIERQRLMPNEILSLPALCFDLPEASKNAIVGYMDEIIQVKKEGFFGVDQQLAELEDKIETALLAGCNLSDTEKVLIEDLLRFSLGAFQDKENSDAYHPCNSTDLNQYAKYLCSSINQFLENTPNLSAWASVFELTPRSPLNIVALRLNKAKKAGETEILPGATMQQALKDIEEYTYRKHSESIYYRKFIRYHSGDTIYIVKPNEKRCWSRSLGLNDGDEIIAEILENANAR
ncbi:MAG: SAM-dependent methyltransferase [Saprospiraceae bacterium]|nr:SAM-dependent methyltransferase [Saprospiraceae bacterium]MCF8251976.1 SAM-dependent methyltransferase [Saprospiraceae bacterium]MCF8281689.1 SAM-dependent methyltransferase [Bacteroidales bacterium]MCF8313677.1 SAM-dependent methyltransferase [Saprospiraceae bacterium]MCF8442384.1 SAM-dependent methyltransferase [Saprospiraceae bacterium]